MKRKIVLDVRRELFGEEPGHPFRGNQYTDEGGAGSESSSSGQHLVAEHKEFSSYAKSYTELRKSLSLAGTRRAKLSKDLNKATSAGKSINERSRLHTELDKVNRDIDGMRSSISLLRAKNQKHAAHMDEIEKTSSAIRAQNKAAGSKGG